MCHKCDEQSTRAPLPALNQNVCTSPAVSFGNLRCDRGAIALAAINRLSPPSPSSNGAAAHDPGRTSQIMAPQQGKCCACMRAGLDPRTKRRVGGAVGAMGGAVKSPECDGDSSNVSRLHTKRTTHSSSVAAGEARRDQEPRRRKTRPESAKRRARTGGAAGVRHCRFYRTGHWIAAIELREAEAS